MIEPTLEFSMPNMYLKIGLENYSKNFKKILKMFILLIGLTIIFIASYKRGVSLIFNSIELAIIEIKNQLKYPSEKLFIQSRQSSMV